MNIRTRHMAILTYSGLAAIILLKGDIITNATEAAAIVAPLIGMFTWDKIKGTQTK